jgi:demethylmenaquinone methyltransferase/2-methoxy-6-polyprenyl-1,4-benzoquinol methylase
MTQLVTQDPKLPQLGSGQMFDRIAQRYDTVNRVLSFGQDQRWRRRVCRELFGKGASWFGEKPRVLDVATGTGDLAIAIAKFCPGATVIGLDPSPGMLEIAEQKIAKRGLADRISLTVGDAQELPLKNCEIDAATIAFGIRNVPDRGKGLRELRRVVRPGGRIAVLELGEPQKGVMGAMARLHSHHLVPAIGGLLSGSREYKYLQKSVAAFPPPSEFADLMRASGLEVLKVLPLTFGVCNLYLATPAEEA